MSRIFMLSLYSIGSIALPISLACFVVLSCKKESVGELQSASKSQNVTAATNSDQFHQLLSLLLTIKSGATLSEAFQHFDIPAPKSDDPGTYAFVFSSHLEGSETWYEFSDRYAVSFFSERYTNYSNAKSLTISNESLYVRVSVNDANWEDWRMIFPYWKDGVIVPEP